jgi:hypothetical protein
MDLDSRINDECFPRHSRFQIHRCIKTLSEILMMKRLMFRIQLCCLTLIFLPCLVWATKFNSEEDWSNVNDNISIPSNQMERKLQALCDDGSKPVVHYFEVIVRIQPDATVTGICTLADQMKLGSDINKILLSHVSLIWMISSFDSSD